MKQFRSHQRPKKNLLIAGRNSVLAAIREGKPIDRIYLDGKIQGAAVSEIRNLAGANAIPINYVPQEKIKSFNVEGSEGCVALLSRVHYQDLQEVISWVVEKGEAPLFLILDGVTDIRNIGGIARTALCTGVHALIIPDKGVGALNEDAVLTSAGALEKLPVCRVGSLLKAIDTLHLNGILVLASEMKAKTAVYEVEFKQPVAIIMGSEDKGIYPALMKASDIQFFIPMKNEFESLNVSVATGMILYEAMKQRMEL